MTEDKGTLVPQIRFRGFTDAWVQRKLGEVAEFSKGNGYSKGDLIDKGNPIILYGRLYTNYETLIENVDAFTKMKENSVLSQGGEVIIPSSGETAEDISRASVVAKAGIILGGDLNIVKPDSTIYPTFLAIIISNGNQQKELSKRAQGKSVVHISNSDLKEVVLQLPSIIEQIAINNFFRTLDDTITLYKRKLDGLKELKKGYLQQMFPQAGKDVPQLRFTGFAGNWEKMRLGEVSTKVGRRNSNGEDFPAYSINNQVGFIPQGEQFEDSRLDNLNKDAYKIVEPNDFAYNPARVNVGSIAFNNLAKSVIISSLYVVVKMDESVDNGFVLQYIMSPEFITEVRKNTEGTVREYLFYENFANIAFPFAPIKAEQAAIGNFFRNIDEQILDQQSKLDKLKQLKSAYLQKMFI